MPCGCGTKKILGCAAHLASLRSWHRWCLARRPRPSACSPQGLYSAGLTNFLVNEPVHGYIADFLDPALRLILEVDGYRTDGTWLAFQDDRARQNVLVAHGYTVLRYTAHDVQTRLGSILDEVTDLVARISQQSS